VNSLLINAANLQVLYKGPSGHDAHDSFTLMMDNGAKVEVPCHALQPRSKVQACHMQCHTVCTCVKACYHCPLHLWLWHSFTNVKKVSKVL